MTDRAVSTVLDVALFLLLVGVAVLTLVAAPSHAQDPADGSAHEVATVIGSSTATVNATGAASDTARGSSHGTLAGLLADVAVRTADVDGSPIGGPDALVFADGAVDAARPALGGRNWRAQVVVAWRPFEGAHLRNELRVGRAPPPTADVHAATTTVASGLPSAGDEARAVADDGGFDAVADAVASSVVLGLFPPSETRAALADPVVAESTIRRYRAAGDAYGVSVAGSAEQGRVHVANDRLRTAVADRLAADLEREYETPIEAADAVEVGTVRITVRAWSA